MGVLPDHKISRELAYGDLKVEPVDLESQLQPASLDIRLGNEVAIQGRGISDSEWNYKTLDDNEGVLLMPGDFAIANTKEYFDFPSDILGWLTGRSSVARKGLSIHQVAGLFDPGFQGEGVFEICNVSNSSATINSGMKISQMVFQKLDGSANNPYNEEDNHYQNQEGAVTNRSEL